MFELGLGLDIASGGNWANSAPLPTPASPTAKEMLAKKRRPVRFNGT